MFCPKCRYEYERHVKTCPSCKVELVSRLVENCNDEPVVRAMHPVKLTYVSDHIEAVLLMNLLKNRGIHCYSIDSETGNYMRMTKGYSVFGEIIYVDKADYFRAFELLNEVSNKIELSDEDECLLSEAGNEDFLDKSRLSNQSEEEDLEYLIPFYKKPQFIAGLTLFIMIGSLLFCLI